MAPLVQLKLANLVKVCAGAVIAAQQSRKVKHPMLSQENIPMHPPCGRGIYMGDHITPLKKSQAEEDAANHFFELCINCSMLTNSVG